MKQSNNNQELINHIAKELELNLSAYSFKETVDAITTLYYLANGYSPENWNDVAETVLRWEGQYATIESVEDVNESILYGEYGLIKSIVDFHNSL
jgi:hypothetical protein